MQELLTIVIASLTSALVVTSAYHLLVAAPRVAKLRAIVDQHDAMLGGGTKRATDRLGALERDAAEAARAREGQARRIESLEKIARTEMPRIGFVRFNAFDDVGSDLSYALALLSGEGDGVVLTSIYSREDTRTYGKGVTAFKPATDPSEEELAAIAKSRTTAS